jgi:hypothetical protein
MVKDEEIEDSVSTFFLLWQRQAALMAQRPDQSLQEMTDQAQLLAEQWRAALPSNDSDHE